MSEHQRRKASLQLVPAVWAQEGHRLLLYHSRAQEGSAHKLNLQTRVLLWQRGKWAGPPEGCSRQCGTNWGWLASHSVQQCGFYGQIFVEKETWQRMKPSAPLCCPSQSPLEQLCPPTPFSSVASWLCLSWWSRADCAIVIKFVPCPSHSVKSEW